MRPYSWCGPCKTLSPILEKLAGDADTKTGSGRPIDLVTVDTEEHVALAQRYNVCTAFSLVRLLMVTKHLRAGARLADSCGVPRWGAREAVCWRFTREWCAQVPRRCLNRRSEPWPTHSTVIEHRNLYHRALVFFFHSLVRISHSSATARHCVGKFQLEIIRSESDRERGSRDDERFY